jgi:hypothetical protein
MSENNIKYIIRWNNYYIKGFDRNKILSSDCIDNAMLFNSDREAHYIIKNFISILSSVLEIIETKLKTVRIIQNETINTNTILQQVKRLY